MKNKYDCIIIGGGIAGISIALNLLKFTDYKIAMLEREERLGGVLNQCIHEGFGLTYLGENLTGPEYLDAFLSELDSLKDDRLTIYKSTEVVDVKKIEGHFEIEAMDRRGFIKASTRSVIYSTGCTERHINNLLLNKSRVRGIHTAGQAQNFINLKGNIEKFKDKKIVIVGTGDIGMIMARRFKIEGMDVECILERNQEISGSYRNKVDCLDKYDVKLKLNSEIMGIKGRENIEGIYISTDKVEEFIECDLIVSAIGLVPEDDLLVDESGVFILGNGDYVHALVDDINFESDILYKYVDEYLKKDIYRVNRFEKNENKSQTEILCTLCPKGCVKEYGCDKGREASNQENSYSITTSVKVLDGTERRLFAKTKEPVSLEKSEGIIEEIKLLKILDYVDQEVELESKISVLLKTIRYI